MREFQFRAANYMNIFKKGSNSYLQLNWSLFPVYLYRVKLPNSWYDITHPFLLTLPGHSCTCLYQYFPGQLVLSRKMSFYIVTYYLPSGLFVVVSWISFLVNPEVTWAETITKYFQLLLNQRGLKSLSCVFLPIAKVCQLKVIPGRMTLLITIFLVLINIFNTIQTNSPQVEKNIKATRKMRFSTFWFW